jgi:uncharacterized protein YggE
MINRIMLALAGLLLVAAISLIVLNLSTPRVAPTVEASGLGAPSAQVTNAIDPGGISVSGTGRVQAKPNIATTNLGIETTSATLADAMTQANTKMSAIIDKVKSFGVADKDIQTSSFNISPVLNQPKQGEAPKITGYRVSNQVNVTIRKIDDVGKILDGVVAAGANNVYGISFSVDDPTPYQQQARAAAVKDAQDKAGQLAKGAGITLGKVISISEGGVSPVPVFRAASALSADSAVPIATGQMDISVSVDMRFAIP